MAWFKGVGKQPGWLAFGVHADHIDLVHIKRSTGGRPEVALCDSYRKEGSDTDTLLRLRKELKLDQFRSTTLLKFADYQLHQVEAPNVPAAELKTAVRWRIKDVIDYPLEQATIDVLDIPIDASGSARTHSLYVVATRTETIGRLVKPFNDADVPLEAVDIPALAQRNIATLYEQEGRGLALLGFHEECGKLTFSCGGELYMTRRIEITQAQLLDANEDRRKEFFERIALELQRSLDHFDRISVCRST
jgi:MSHA biogenesis protein MshI